MPCAHTRALLSLLSSTGMARLCESLPLAQSSHPQGRPTGVALLSDGSISSPPLEKPCLDSSHFLPVCREDNFCSEEIGMLLHKPPAHLLVRCHRPGLVVPSAVELIHLWATWPAGIRGDVLLQEKKDSLSPQYEIQEPSFPTLSPPCCCFALPTTEPGAPSPPAISLPTPRWLQIS